MHEHDERMPGELQRTADGLDAWSDALRAEPDAGFEDRLLASLDAPVPIAAPRRTRRAGRWLAAASVAVLGVGATAVWLATPGGVTPVPQTPSVAVSDEPALADDVDFLLTMLDEGYGVDTDGLETSAAFVESDLDDPWASAMFDFSALSSEDAI